MMYNALFVAAIKVDGKVLREFKDKVYLPFGCEYEIFLKNLHPTKRVRVDIEINGQRNNHALVLNAAETFTLDRFLSSANKLKFIERTEQIEQHRGVGACDGLVVLNYNFELDPPQFNEYAPLTQQTPFYSRPTLSYPSGVRGSSFGGRMTDSTALNSSVPTADSMLSNGVAAGITVPGQKSNQSFKPTSFRSSSKTETIVFQLLGGSLEPVTTKTTLECPLCGNTEPATAKFCSACGTALKLY